MAYALDTYIGDGATKTFSVTFPYLERAHVKVFVNGLAQVEGGDFAFLSDTQIQFDTAPAQGAVIKFKRETSPSDRLTDYTVGNLTEEDLDNDSLQAFYMAQEVLDTVEETITVSLATNQWDAGNKRLTNVAPATEGTDAVNKDQLDAVQVAAGNVPTPDDPGEDDHFLVAGGGAWDWASPADAKTILGISSFAETLLDDADAATARKTLDVPQKIALLNRPGLHKTTGGSNNAYTLDLDDDISSYAAGQLFTARIDRTNTGAATLNVNDIGAIPIQIAGRALLGAELLENTTVIFIIQVISGVTTAQLIGDGDGFLFTPELTCTTPGNLSVTYDAQYGFIYRMGGLVHVTCQINTNTFSHSTASGGIRVVNVPTARTVTDGRWIAPCAYSGMNKSGYHQLVAITNSGQGFINFIASGNNQQFASANIADFPSGASVRLQFSIWYPI